MRNLLLILLIGFAAYGGYSLWTHHKPEASEPQEKQPSIQSDVAESKPLVSDTSIVPSPAPLPVQASENTTVEPSAPMPPAKRLAPEGVYYVIQAFSVTSETGIKGVPLGTKLTLIKDMGDSLRVTDGRSEFDARREFITNDLDIATHVHALATNQKAALAEWHEKQKAAAAEMEAQKSTEAAIGQDRGQRNLAIANLRARDAALAQEESRLRQIIAEIQSAPTPQRTKIIRGIDGSLREVDMITTNTNSTRKAELPALRARLDTIQRERRAIPGQIKALQ